MDAGAGTGFLLVGGMAGLQVGRALGYSGCLGLGSTENSWLESTFDLGSGYQVTKYLPLKKLFTGLKIIHLYL